MSVALPLTPAPSRMTIGVVSTDNILSPDFGGDDQELLRKGTRYALTFQMPPMRYETAMAWSTLRRKGVLVAMQVFQPGFDIGVPGSANRVQGAGQAGSLLAVDGLTPNYIIRQGQFLSVITEGQRFLYCVAETVVANADGEALVPLESMLRRPPADNDVVEIAQPVIEGFVRDLDEWSVGVDRLVGLKFTVRERE